MYGHYSPKDDKYQLFTFIGRGEIKRKEKVKVGV